MGYQVSNHPIKRKYPKEHVGAKPQTYAKDQGGSLSGALKSPKSKKRASAKKGRH